jgi:2-methylcitrate dehydratase PrpD
LACAGIPAPQEAIGGAFGFLSLLETDTHVEPELDRLGKEWRITQLSWKPFPTGRAAHGALVALRQMMDEHAISADNLQSFTYRAPSLIQRLVGRPARADMTGAYARLCFAWLGALQLRNGSIGLADFTPATIADPDLLALSRRLTIEADDNPDLAAFVPAAATAVRHDGQSFHVAVDRQFGAPGWPLDHDQQIDKARRCLTFGGLDGTRTEALFAAVERLDSEADAAAALRAVTTRTIPA